MYAGPGAGPMLAAAAAWGAVAAQLFSTAAGCGSVIAELTTGWQGQAALSMAEAAAPYVAWLHRTATVAEQAAAQVKSAAAAYELAFAMTVPPPVVAANRTLLASLVATNFFGQNALAIAANELQYTQMWLQDAVAMYTYFESSMAATRLTPFTEPPRTGSPPPSPAPGALQGAGAPLSPATWLALLEHVPNVTNTVLSTSNAAASGRGIYAVNWRLAFQEQTDLQQALASSGRLKPGAPVRSVVSAAVGRAIPVGKLSAPPGWLAAAPEIRSSAQTLPPPGAGTITAAANPSEAAPGNVFSQSVLGTLSRHGTRTPQYKSKPIIVRSPAAG